MVSESVTLPAFQEKQLDIRQSSSNTKFAASKEVISALSYCGETSTRSQPTKFNPASARTKSRICTLEKPPTCGVPVPGANAGSTTSISKLRYTLRFLKGFSFLR